MTANKLSFNHWHKFLRQLSEDLTVRNVKDIKFLCKDHLPAGKAEQLSDALTLLEELERLEIFNSVDISQLSELIKEIGRNDLCRKINAYQEQQKSHDFLKKLNNEKTPVEGPDNSAHEYDKVAPIIPGPSTKPSLSLLSPEYFRKKAGQGVQDSNGFSSSSTTFTSEHEEYPMKRIPRGRCLLFSNNFEKLAKLDDGSCLGKRTGTEYDVKSLTETFTWLGFAVEEYLNKSKGEMTEILEQVAKDDHSGYDCFVCCVLTHGFDGGVYGNDGGMLQIRDIMARFSADQCTTLMQKPKLFFIQACQGENDSKGVTIQADSPIIPRADAVDTPPAPVNKEIPQYADFFFFMATTSGTISWRDPTTGSWFVQCLCKVLKDRAMAWSLSDINLEVNNKMAQKEDKGPEGATAKQMSDAGRNTLRKKLYFHPRRQFSPLPSPQKQPVESPCDDSNFHDLK